MTRDEILARANRAKLLIEDELLTEAFKALEAEYITGWRQTSARDTDARERLWQAVQVIGKVKQHLVVALNNGKLTQRELDDMAAKEKRFWIV